MILQRITGKKKKITTTLGSISINNSHVFSHPPNGFRLSSLLQELMVYAATLDPYSKGHEVLQKFICADVNAVQLWRVSECYGRQISEQNKEALQRSAPPLSHSDTLYVEADGSMILSRDEGWKEVKVGRLFKASDCLHPCGKPGFIKQSRYVATLKDSKGFYADMEELLEHYGGRPSQLVFISDGAPWLRNWIADAYPQAVSVLDFYHAAEHLHLFCEAHFSDKEAGGRWAAVQKELLVEGEVKMVIANIEQQSNSKAAQALIKYYRDNEGRMEYKRYSAMGCGLIGSGAIESAHRTVVQSRMKLSGQRWSVKGAEQMLQLRVVYMNNQWNRIIDLSKQTKAKAA